MAYGLKVPEGLLNKVCEGRERLIDVIERELAKLAEDPKTLGRKTPSPPSFESAISTISITISLQRIECT